MNRSRASKGARLFRFWVAIWDQTGLQSRLAAFNSSATCQKARISQWKAASFVNSKRRFDSFSGHCNAGVV